MVINDVNENLIILVWVDLYRQLDKRIKLVMGRKGWVLSSEIGSS